MKVSPVHTILMIRWSWQDENNINHNYYKARGNYNSLLVLNWNHLPLVLTVRQTSANWCGELLSLLEDRDINKCGNWDNQAGQLIVQLKSHLISTIQVFWDRDITFFLKNKHNIIRWALLNISHLVQIGFLASKVFCVFFIYITSGHRLRSLTHPCLRSPGSTTDTPWRLIPYLTHERTTNTRQ